MSDTTTTDKTAPMEGETIDAPKGGEVVHLDLHRTPTFAERPTVWSRMPLSQRELLKSKAPLLSEHELSIAMELAVAYRLDPYTGEIWFTKSNPYTDNRGNQREGKLLIMVGRDGLRKIVTRNGLWMKCEVVHEGDDVQVIHSADGNVTITHTYKITKSRGEILGAWALVRRGGPDGELMGWFYAPLEEYKPANPDSRSPWAKQVSVMIMAAAERQAARQATPLGGLLVEGEDEVIDATYEEMEVERDAESSTLPEYAKELVERARSIGFQGYDYGTVEVILGGGQTDEMMRAWTEGAHKELDVWERDKKICELDEEWGETDTRMRTEAEAIKARIEDATRANDEDKLAAATAEKETLGEQYRAARTEYQEAREALMGEQTPNAA